MSTTGTHEEYLHRTREAVIERARELGTITDEQAERLEHSKLVYGIGNGSYRGVCHYDAWENGIGRVDVIEVAATAEESWVQLAGTTIHELGHVLAGWGAGHSSAWKAAASKLGLRAVEAAGQRYVLSAIDPKVRERVYELANDLGDGKPEFRTYGLGIGTLRPTVRPCSAGIGTRGGKSRGKGSGSRLRLWECECDKPVKVRVASDDFAATCDRCGKAFHKAGGTTPPAPSADEAPRMSDDELRQAIVEGKAREAADPHAIVERSNGSGNDAGPTGAFVLCRCGRRFEATTGGRAVGAWRHHYANKAITGETR
jgi:hypothetical protein